MAIIDGHAHATVNDFARYPARPDVAPHTLQHVSENPFTAENLITEMDAIGVDHAVLVQLNSIYRIDNSYVIDAAAANPKRISAIIGIDAVRIPQAELDDLLDRGAKGFRLSCNQAGIAEDSAEHYTGWLDSDAASRVWGEARDRHLPISISFARLSRAAGMDALREVAGRFSDVDVLIDHLAYFDFDPTRTNFGLDVLDPLDLPNVHFKISPQNFDSLEALHIDPADFLRRVCDRFGAERMSFGSDITSTPGTYEELFDRGHAAARLLTEGERDLFFGGSLSRVFDIGDTR